MNCRLAFSGSQMINTDESGEYSLRDLGCIGCAYTGLISLALVILGIFGLVTISLKLTKVGNLKLLQVSESYCRYCDSNHNGHRATERRLHFLSSHMAYRDDAGNLHWPL